MRPFSPVRCRSHGQLDCSRREECRASAGPDHVKMSAWKKTGLGERHARQQSVQHPIHGMMSSIFERICQIDMFLKYLSDWNWWDIKPIMTSLQSTLDDSGRVQSAR